MGADGAGGIAGEMQTSGGTSSIAASSFTGIVSAETSSAAYAGGILGQSYSGFIERCYAAGNVEARAVVADARAGGIVGSFGYFPVSDCYAYTNVYSTSPIGSFAGGIAGHAPEIARCYAAGTVETGGSGPVYAGGISGRVTNTGGLTDCMVLLDILDGGPSPDAHTLFGGYDIWYPTNTGNKVWDDIAITQGGTTYTSGSYTTTADYDIASFTAAASFQGSSSQATYAGWNFTPGTGAWKWIAGYDYPVLSWQDSPPDLSVVPDSFVVTWP
jgi:hypothetical protein